MTKERPVRKKARARWRWKGPDVRTRVGVKSHSTAEQTDPAGLNATGRMWRRNPQLLVRLQVHAPAVCLQKREARKSGKKKTSKMSRMNESSSEILFFRQWHSFSSCKVWTWQLHLFNHLKLVMILQSATEPFRTSWFQRDQRYRVLYRKIFSCSSTTYAIESLFHADQHFYVQKCVFCNKCSKISECVLTLAHPVWFLNTHGAADISRAWIKWLMTSCNDPSLHILKSHLREMKAEFDRWTLSLSSF